MRARYGPVGLLTVALALSAIGLQRAAAETTRATLRRPRSGAAAQVTADPASSPFTSKTAFCTKDTANTRG